jgi:hypothetical protein
MARTLGNPDRNFSIDGDAPSADGLKDLRRSLIESDPALAFNEAAKLRIGKVITDAILPVRIRPRLKHLGPRRP